MEVLATLKAHNKQTGAYLGRAEVITACDCCGDMDEFTDEHGADIGEYLYNLLSRKINAHGVIFQLRLIELEDDNEDESELDEDEVINDFRRWLL